MHKITKKDSTNLPDSLQFNDGNPKTRKAKTTYEKWKIIIQQGVFPADNTFASRYKQDDIKQALKQHYHSKCAYCEQYVERWDVEHYRPKKVYYWLAYSWDNLLLACPTCNQDYKKDQFEVVLEQAKYTVDVIQNIHCLSEKYHELEQPKLLNPEFDQIENIFTYDLYGNISSQDIRGQYTIKTCGLDRAALSDRRKEIVIDSFKNKLQEEFITNANNKEVQLSTIKTFIKIYKSECHLLKNEFLDFRHYVQNHLLSEIIKSAIS